VDLRRDRGILRTLAIDFDLAVELREFPMGGTEELMHTETNRRPRWIELVSLVRRCCGTQRGDCERSDQTAQSHFELFFVSAASVFKSGVRESGSRPNRFPSAKAGSALRLFISYAVFCLKKKIKKNDEQPCL